MSRASSTCTVRLSFDLVTAWIIAQNSGISESVIDNLHTLGDKIE